MGKNPSPCDCTEIQTHAPTSEGFKVTKLNHRGDPQRRHIMKKIYSSLDTELNRSYRTCRFLQNSNEIEGHIIQSIQSISPVVSGVVVSLMLLLVIPIYIVL